MRSKVSGKNSSGRYKGKIIAAGLLVFMYVLPLLSHTVSLAYTIDPGSRAADPDTSTPAHMGFLDIPWLQDGRIWTDKSVSVNLGADDFTVTLSALSQSYAIIDDGYIVPADTVFILDVSGSMYQERIGDRPRIAVLVDALNEAIDILLDANPQNRIAVVAYGGLSGGHSRAVNVLPLDRPELMPGATAYFTYRQAGANHYVDVNTTVKEVPTVQVQGSTPTQRGIYLGARVLETASDLTIQALDAEGEPAFDGLDPILVTRMPNIILMTDGEPTMAWTDYLFLTEPDDDLHPHTHGNGSDGETGLSLLTVLTAAHRKKLVYEHYFTDNGLHVPDVINVGEEAIGFYTISLNDIDPPPLISATMFPFDPINTAADGYADEAEPYEVNLITIAASDPYPGLDTDDSMGALLRDFAVGTPIEFWIQRRDAFDDYEWEELDGITNSLPLTIDDLAYADMFVPASDLQTLRDAFLKITTDIQIQSLNLITDADPDRLEFDGYLVFSDVLGEYMEFRGTAGLMFDDVYYARDDFGPDVIANISDERADFEEVLYNHLNYGNMPFDLGFDASRYVSEPMVTELIEANIESGHLTANNSIKYYADLNRDYAGSFFDADGSEAARPLGKAAVVELFPMWGDIGTPVITIGGETDLMYIAFHVITALDDDSEFEEIFDSDSDGNPLRRTLNRGDQMIRWYIPAVLIPQRKVDPATGDISGNELPVRVSYVVGLNEARITAGEAVSYIASNRSGNNVYFYTNRYHDNVTLAFYRPHANNPYYHPGRPGYDERGSIKTVNTTMTAPHVTFNRHESIAGERTDLHWLGNNGRLTIILPSPPGRPPPIPPPPSVTPPDEPPVDPPGEPPGQPPDPPGAPPRTPQPPDPPFYTPPDPPNDSPPGRPPPSQIPRTGDSLQTVSYIAITIISIGIMSGIIILRNRGRMFYKGKHLAKRR